MIFNLSSKIFFDLGLVIHKVFLLFPSHVYPVFGYELYEQFFLMDKDPV